MIPIRVWHAASSSAQPGPLELRCEQWLDESEVERAVKELRAFSKVKLDPRDETDIEMSIPLEKLAYYDEETSSWKMEPGTYKIYVGNASDNIMKEMKIKVK